MLSSDYALAGEQIVGHPSLTDPLTGLANRLHFGLVYRYMFTAGDRGTAFTVMLLSCGAGSSEEIKVVGEAVERTTRTSDLVSHVGQGRYVVLLIGTNLPGAQIAADRIGLALEAVAPAPISVGLAVHDPRMKDPAQLLELADKALLAAEAGGGGIQFA